MPTLLPRESTCATSVIRAHVQRPSPADQRVGFSIKLTRLLIGSLAFRPAILPFGNSRPRVTTTPLPHATEAYGQLFGRDFNPPDLLLLLRTVSVSYFERCETNNPAPLNYGFATTKKVAAQIRLEQAACRSGLRLVCCTFSDSPQGNCQSSAA